MKPRLDYAAVAPDALKTIAGLEKYLGNSDLEEKLTNLVRIRASQINGCVWCLDMHTKDALAGGADDQKLYLLPVWREALVYDERERAALEWTEQLTRLSQNQSVPDDIYALVKKHFSDKEIVDLTLAVIAINSWNKLNVAFKNVVCNYVPKSR